MTTEKQAKTNNWFQFANCRDSDPNLFYADEESKQFPGGGEPARLLCMACPVRLDCLDYAMSISEQCGIWGGMNYAQRTRLRRKRTKTFDQFEEDIMPAVVWVANSLSQDAVRVDGRNIPVRSTQDWLDIVLKEREDDEDVEDSMQYMQDLY